MQDLAGQVAVVTGAGSGIGRALALALGAEGMKVAAADVDAASAEETAEMLIAQGSGSGDVLARATDVRLEADVDALAAAVRAEWGQVDVLCNNAGVFVGGLIWERPTADLEYVLGVNLWGILHGIRAFVPGMIAQGTPGHVVNTCSIAGHHVAGYSGPYCISKFAALAATESLARDLELAGSALKVTALCPGMVDTSIGTKSESRRPDALRTEVTESQEVVTRIMLEVAARGIDPAEVGQMVVQAIRDETFLLFTHQHHAGPLVDRARDLGAGRLPPMADFE